ALRSHLEKNILLVPHRKRLYNGIKDALSGSDQRTTPPPLRGEMVLAQDRAAYADRPPHDCQVSRSAGCEGRSPRPLQQARSIQGNHCRVAPAGPGRQRPRDRAAIEAAWI